MGRDPNVLGRLLQTLFPRNENLLAFLQTLPLADVQDVVDSLPDTVVPRDEYFRRAVEQLRAYNLDSPLFFDHLGEKFTLKSELIRQTKSIYFRTGPTVGDEIGVRPSTRKALLRSLLPFEDGDELVGRDLEVQSVTTIVRSGGFRFGVVWGRSGSGKTSLIRAGVVPALRAAGLFPMYFDRPVEELMADPASALQSWAQVGEAGQQAQKLVLVIDQLEGFFLRTKDRADHQRLANLIGAALDVESRPISFLLVIREDFFGKLHHLSIKNVPDPTKPTNCYELEELTPEVAEEILRTSVVSDRTQFSDELIREITQDLTVEGSVRPVELQIVGTALKQRRIKQKNGYDTVGGARGLLQTYIKDEIASCSDKQMAALVLRRLCAEGRLVKAPEDVSKDALAEAAIRAGLDPHSDRDLLKRTIERLIEAKLVVQTGDELYNLVHDFIASLVPVATAGLDTAKEQANRLILKYLAEYREDPMFRIPRRHLRFIRKNADQGVRAEGMFKKLYFRSVVSAVGATLLPISIVGTAFVAAYATLYVSEYLSTEPARYVKGTPAIVVLAGHPLLKVLPGFDSVRVDTGYFMLDVNTGNPEPLEAIPGERLTGFTWPGKHGHSQWAEALFPRLSLEGRVVAWRLVGDVEQALEAAKASITAGWTQIGSSLGLFAATLDTSQRSRISGEMREILTTGKPEAMATAAAAIGHLMTDRADRGAIKVIFRQTFDRYLELATLEQAGPPDSELSSQLEIFQNGLIALILASADVVGEQESKMLLDFVANPNSDPNRERLALELLHIIALANPDRTSTIFRRMVHLVAANEDSWENRERTALLGSIAAAYPKEVVSEALSPLAPLIVDGIDFASVIAYGLTAGRNPVAASPDVVASIQSCAAVDGGEGKSSKAAINCALALMRMQSVGFDDRSALAKIPAPIEEDIEIEAHTAVYLALIGRPSMLSEDERSALLNRFIGGECSGSHRDVLDNPDPYWRFYTVIEANKKVFKPDHVRELQRVFKACMWGYSHHHFVKLLLAAAKYQPEATLALKDDLNKLDGSSGWFENDETNRQLHEWVAAALARAAYERGKADGSLSLGTIRALLETREQADKRTFGSYAAYLFWLDKNDERGALEGLLRDLSARPEADVRMAANRAIEMIWVARSTVGGASDVPVNLALARLTVLMGHPEIPIAVAARFAWERLANAWPQE